MTIFPRRALRLVLLREPLAFAIGDVITRVPFCNIFLDSIINVGDTMWHDAVFWLDIAGGSATLRVPLHPGDAVRAAVFIGVGRGPHREGERNVACLPARSGRLSK